MKDGILGKCKECTKADVRENRSNRREYYSNYDRERFKRPERKKQFVASLRRQRIANPQKAKARNAVSNAIRDGRLFKLPCEFCGESQKVEAHHGDYSKPLDVVWVCFKCHREKFHNQIVI